jgi:thiol-disulfide isomerase/thioredoxin
VAVGAIVAAAVVLAAALAGLARARREGRLRYLATPPHSDAGSGPERLTAARLGEPLGERATLLQFSSAFCAPCRATRRLLAELASVTPGVRHVELDVAARLDLVRALDVRRTPTMFVLGPDGEIARRASGLPRRADLVAALAEVAGPRPARPPGDSGPRPE